MMRIVKLWCRCLGILWSSIIGDVAAQNRQAYSLMSCVVHFYQELDDWVISSGSIYLIELLNE